MRSIDRAFKKVQKENPFKGDYICLSEAVKGKKYTRRTIRCALLKNVPKDDYDEVELNTLITHLHIRSNIVVDDHFDDKIRVFDVYNNKDE